MIFIFSPKEIWKIFTLFGNFVHFNWGKKYAYFLRIGKKICIFTLFSSPFNHFVPQHIFWGVKQKNIHPCGSSVQKNPIFFLLMQVIPSEFSTLHPHRNTCGLCSPFFLKKNIKKTTGSKSYKQGNLGFFRCRFMTTQLFSI